MRHPETFFIACGIVLVSAKKELARHLADKNLMLKSENVDNVEIVGDNSISKTILDDKVEALQFNVTGTTVDSTDSE